jgi:hypothetical protein
MGKRVQANIMTMTKDGYTVLPFAQDAKTQIVDYLCGIHHEMVLLVAKKQPPDRYMTLAAMTARVNWVTELGSRRGKVGEKKLQLILAEFPLSFRREYMRDSDAMIRRLSKRITKLVCPREQS